MPATTESGRGATTNTATIVMRKISDTRTSGRDLRRMTGSVGLVIVWSTSDTADL